MTNLVNYQCIDEEERYDLFMRLNSDYCVHKDSAHFVSRQIDLLNRERNENFKTTSMKQKISISNLNNLQGCY